MDKNKFALKKVANDAGKGMVNLFEKAKDGLVKIADQNDDGVFDHEDILDIVDKINVGAKDAAEQVKLIAEEKGREIEYNMLQPIFIEDIQSSEFCCSKLIRITEMSKRYADSEVCQGAIGYITSSKDYNVINIFRHKLDLFGITLYPNNESEVYYVDPMDNTKYIALEDYFGFLKKARVSELQMIAQSLGAKHFKVTYKEQKVYFSSKRSNGKINFKNGMDALAADRQKEFSTRELSDVEIAAESNFIGQDPVEPKLVYLSKEDDIQALVKLRMHSTSPLTSQKYTLQLSNTSGIKESDAVKIDAALKVMKVNGNTTVLNEVQDESRRFFEYLIEF